MENFIERPWGSYTIIEDTPSYKLKKIVVKPGEKLSLQSHGKRDELWTIVSGKGIVVLDGLEIIVSYGKTVDIHRGQKHRVTNTGSEDLVFIEVQTGEYFGEDDIKRFDDIYGRA